MNLFERAVLTAVHRLVKLDGGETVPSDAMIIYQETFGPARVEGVLEHIGELDA